MLLQCMYYALTMKVLCSHHGVIMLLSWRYYALAMEIYALTWQVLCSHHEWDTIMKINQQ
jgi:hypothetical protein